MKKPNPKVHKNHKIQQLFPFQYLVLFVGNNLDSGIDHG